MEIGTICIKTRGREAGKRVVIISEAKKGRVLVDGKDVKRKECNVLHLYPLSKKVKISKDAKHEDVLKVLK